MPRKSLPPATAELVACPDCEQTQPYEGEGEYECPRCGQVFDIYVPDGYDW